MEGKRVTTLKVRKGQITILAIFGILITLAVYSVIYPTMKSFIDTFTPIADPLTVQMLALVPAFIVIGLLLTTIFYAVPQN